MLFQFRLFANSNNFKQERIHDLFHKILIKIMYAFFSIIIADTI